MDVHLIQNKDTERKKRNSKSEYLRRLHVCIVSAFEFHSSYLAIKTEDRRHVTYVSVKRSTFGYE